MADECQKALANIPFEQRIKIAFSRITTIYTKEEMFEFAVEETLVAAEAAATSGSDLEFGSSERTSLTADITDIDQSASCFKDSSNLAKSIFEVNTVSIKGLDEMIR